MQDTTTGKQIYVSTDGNSLPYIMVPLEQLDEVKQLLGSHKVDFWVEENAVSLNDQPSIAVINLHRRTDVQAVQNLLDTTQ